MVHENILVTKIVSVTHNKSLKNFNNKLAISELLKNYYA